MVKGGMGWGWGYGRVSDHHMGIPSNHTNKKMRDDLTQIDCECCGRPEDVQLFKPSIMDGG